MFQRTTRVDESTGVVIAGRAGAFVKERVCSSTTEWAVTPRRSLLQLDVSRSWSRSIADSIDDRRSLADVRLTDDVFVTRVDVVEFEGARGDE